MTFIDEKGRLFGKINIFDLFVLVVLLLIGGAVYIKFFGGSGPVQVPVREIRYDVELREKNKGFVDVIKIGDEIRNSINGRYLGKVVGKKVLPEKVLAEDLVKGRYIKADMPGKYTVILTLEAEVKVYPQSITLEGGEIKIGKKIYIKGKGYAGSGYIVGINLKGES